MKRKLTLKETVLQLLAKQKTNVIESTEIQKKLSKKFDVTNTNWVHNSLMRAVRQLVEDGSLLRKDRGVYKITKKTLKLGMEV